MFPHGIFREVNCNLKRGEGETDFFLLLVVLPFLHDYSILFKYYAGESDFDGNNHFVKAAGIISTSISSAL